MKNNRLSAREWGERILLALLFTAIGSLIMIVFSPLRPLLDRVADYLGRIGLILLLLIAVLLVRKSTRFEKYWQVLLGLLIMTIAVSLDWVFGRYLMDYLGVNGNTPVSFALLKLNECAVVVCMVVLFTRMSGGSLGSIYIQKGSLKLGLIIGLIAFFVCVAGSIPMTFLMFKPGGLTFARIISWIPWVLISVLANAAQEELLFRGLFLRKLQPFFGKFLSTLLIVFVFTLLHKGITYTSNDFIFLAILFPLGLAWGYVMQKTDSVWGSILFHAGTDIPIFLGIFSNFK
ncbi:MAG: CPBP family intramembrane metalloprotease [Chloroflexi bacterium]|nr:CPBP family intramembrane metalloprotease [Chloroflexota bacterium]